MSVSITVGSSGVDYSDPTKPVFKGAVGFGGRGLSIWKASYVSAWGKHGVLFFRASPAGRAEVGCVSHTGVWSEVSSTAAPRELLGIGHCVYVRYVPYE